MQCRITGNEAIRQQPPGNVPRLQPGLANVDRFVADDHLTQRGMRPTRIGTRRRIVGPAGQLSAEEVESNNPTRGTTQQQNGSLVRTPRNGTARPPRRPVPRCWTAKSMTERYVGASRMLRAADRRKRRSKFAPCEAGSNERAPAGTPFYGSFQVAAYRAAAGHTERPGLLWA